MCVVRLFHGQFAPRPSEAVLVLAHRTKGSNQSLSLRHIKRGRGTPGLGCRLGEGITQPLRGFALRAIAAMRRCSAPPVVACDSALRASPLRGAVALLRRPSPTLCVGLSNEGFEPKPLSPPYKKGPDWAPFYMAEREGFEPSIRY